jgi:hypothetical protein
MRKKRMPRANLFEPTRVVFLHLFLLCFQKSDRMKKKDIIKALQVKDLVRLCDMFSLQKGTKQVMIANLLQKSSKIPKYVIVAGGYNENNENSENTDDIAAADARRLLINLLGNFSNDGSIDDQIVKIKGSIQSLNVRIHELNQMDVPNTKYLDILENYSSINNSIDNLKIDANDVYKVALRQGFIGDTFHESSSQYNDGDFNGGGIVLVDVFKRYMKKFLKPVFKVHPSSGATKIYSHREFIDLVNYWFTEHETATNFYLDCNYYDLYCEDKISDESNESDSFITCIVTYDEHPYKHVYFENRNGVFVVMADADKYNENMYIQVKFRNQHILVKKKSINELQTFISDCLRDMKNKDYARYILSWSTQQKEWFYVYLKQAMLFSPVDTMFRLKSVIWDVMFNTGHIIAEMISDDRDIVRFRQHRYGLCWLCSALSMMFIYGKDNEIQFNDKKIKKIWENTKLTYHVLDIAKYYFFKKKSNFDDNVYQKIDKGLYNHGGLSRYIWDKMTNSKIYKIKKEERINDTIPVPTKDSFSKYGFFVFHFEDGGHATGALKLKGEVYIYDSNEYTSINLQLYCSQNRLYFNVTTFRIIGIEPKPSLLNLIWRR